MPERLRQTPTRITLEGLLFLIFCTSSFDIWGTLQVAGFNIRVSHGLILIFSLVVGVGNFVRRDAGGGEVNGAWLFWAFAAVAALSATSTPLMPRSFFYWGWFVLMLVFLHATSVFWSEPGSFVRSFRLYLASFVVLALCGVLQFALACAGIDVLVAQKWGNGDVIRVNAFSYEPSFYGMYLLAGWGAFLAIVFYSPKRLSGLVSRRFAAFGLGATTLALLLSGSRMSIIAMLLVFFCISMGEIVRIVRARTWILHRALMIGVCFLAGLGLSVLVAAKWETFKPLFAGTGIAGTSGVSVDVRDTMSRLTFGAFWESPLIGNGLGSVPYRIAQQQYEVISTTEEAKPYEAMNIFYEILASTGAIGFVMFFSALFLIVYRMLRRTVTAVPRSADRLLGGAILLAFIAQLIVWPFNQNPLRIYIWTLVAFCSGFINASKRSESNEQT